MCKAIEDMRNDGIAKGIAIGETRGEARGIAIGETRGIAIGEAKGILSILLSLVKDGILTVADAAKRANMTVAEFEAKTGLKA